MKTEQSSGSTGNDKLFPGSTHNFSACDKEDSNFFDVKDKVAKKLVIIEDRTSLLLLAGLWKPSVRAEGKY